MGPFKLCQRNKPKTLDVSAYISIHVLLMPWLFRPWAYIQIYSNATKGKESLHFPFLSKTSFPAYIWDLTAIFWILVDCFRPFFNICPTQWVRPFVGWLLEGVTLFNFRGLSAPLVLAQRRQVTRFSIELFLNKIYRYEYIQTKLRSLL